MKAEITLFGSDGEPQSRGQVEVDSRQITLGRWAWGATDALEPRVSLVERIARDWHDDGADRQYQGFDEVASVTFRISPLP